MPGLGPDGEVMELMRQQMAEEYRKARGNRPAADIAEPVKFAEDVPIPTTPEAVERYERMLARLAEMEEESEWRRAKMIEWRDAAKRVESDRDRLAAENAAQAREIERLQTAIRRASLYGNPDNIRRELRATLTPAADASGEETTDAD